MAKVVKNISELIIAVLPESVHLGALNADCDAGCSNPGSGCTNNSGGAGSNECVNWKIDPASLVELESVLVSALARTEELRLLNEERPTETKIAELERKFKAAVAAVRAR